MGSLSDTQQDSSTYLGNLSGVLLQRVLLCYDSPVELPDPAVAEFLYAVEGEDGCAIARWSSDCLQTIVFYEVVDYEFLVAPCEVRIWGSRKPLSQERLHSLLKQWLSQLQDQNFEYGLTTEEMRRVPLATLHRLMQSYMNEHTYGAAETLKLPSEAEIEEIITKGLVPRYWRNSRDFRAQARQLQGVAAYVDAVYQEESPQPMFSVGEATGLDVPTARKLIQQARERGFLTKGNGHIGGRITDKAIEAARLMNAALKDAKRL